MKVLQHIETYCITPIYFGEVLRKAKKKALRKASKKASRKYELQQRNAKRNGTEWKFEDKVVVRKK